MSASLVCFVAVLSVAPRTDDWKPVYKSTHDFEYSVRGQTPGYDEIPPSGTPETFAAPYESGAPLTYDPNFAQSYGADPYAGANNGMYSFGANGPQPYKLGWTSRYDVGFLPKEPTGQGLGHFGVFEFDAEWEHTNQVLFDKIFSVTQQFGLRAWDGPSSTPALATSLPGDVFRIGWDFELASPIYGPWSAQVAFNPSINSDFEGSLSSDSWNWDSRGILFYQPTPHWMYAFGAGFWDRVNDRVVPYAGVIWMPGDRWEWRMVFPEPRVSYFVGNIFGFATWAYVRGEWHVEAYEIQVAGARERVELEDWRVLFGLRKDNGWITTFYEAGWVFGRNVAYAKGTPGFDVSSGFILRGGIRF